MSFSSLSRKRFGLVGTIALFCATCSCVAGCGKPTTSVSSSLSGSSSSSSEATINMKNFPNFVSDYSSLPYEFTTKEQTDPFYWGNIMHNETVLFEGQDDGSVVGYLRYVPKKIISVRDYTLKKEYVAADEFEINGNKLTLKSASTIGHWTKKQMAGNEALPSPYRVVASMADFRDVNTDLVNMGGTLYTESPFYWGTQVSITYAYDLAEINLAKFPTYQLDKLTHVKAKLDAKQAIKISGLGDSVLEGCSSSQKFNHEPYQMDFFDSFGTEIASRFGIEVTRDNEAVGGTTSADGANDAKLGRIYQAKPDLLLVHYGINDLGAKTTPNGYADNISYIVTNVKANLPNCDIILMSPILPFPGVYDYLMFDRYVNKLQSIASISESTIVVDVFHASQELVSNGKDFYDITGNGINHPNDFGHRFYTGCLLSVMTKLG